MKIPAAAAKALAQHVAKAVARLDPDRYHQEPVYVAALFARLDGIVYHDKSFALELRSTIVDDRGPNCAESIWGADFGIVAIARGRYETTRKAVLGQAKRGSLLDLGGGEPRRFREQVLKMSGVTSATVALEVPQFKGIQPRIRIVEVPEMRGPIEIQLSPRRYPHKILAPTSAEPPILIDKPLTIARYFESELIRCLHGDINDRLVKSLERSSLTSLIIEATATTSRTLTV